MDASSITEGEMRAMQTMPSIADWKLPFPSQFKRHHYALALTVLQQTDIVLRQNIELLQQKASQLEVKITAVKRHADRRRGPDIDELDATLTKQCMHKDEVRPAAELTEVLATHFKWCPPDHLKRLVDASGNGERWEILADMIETMSGEPTNTRLFVWMDALHLCTLLCRLRGDEGEDGEADDSAEDNSVETESAEGGGGGGGGGGPAEAEDDADLGLSQAMSGLAVAPNTGHAMRLRSQDRQAQHSPTK